MKNLQPFFILISLAFTACGESPTADFTWSPRHPKAGETVRFTNLSENAKRYDWNLGNMSISSEENPSVVYDQPGSYIVDLLACKGLRCDEKTVTIEVE